MKTNKDYKTTPVRYIRGIGPKKALILNNIGIKTVEDLFSFFPRRYEDRSHFVSLSEVKIGDFVTVRGTVIAKGVRPTRSMKIFELVLDDGTGRLYCLFFNQPYLDKNFQIDDTVIVAGKLEFYKKRLQMNSPEYEIIKETGEDTVHTGRIVPVYPLTEGLSQRTLRVSMKALVEGYCDELEETLPAGIMERHYLLSRKEALRNIHFPENNFLLERARLRIVFEEFFTFELKIARKIARRLDFQTCFKVNQNSSYAGEFLSQLPFKFTQSQKQVMDEIMEDLSRPYPMNRLLQGDVGSGKTIIAAYALYVAARHKFQGAFLVPTEILAEQHFNTVSKLFDKLNVTVSLLTGSTPTLEKRNIIDAVRGGTLDVVIGTHALIQEEVKFKNLGFVVIDEQHKFGVRQRAYLRAQKRKPHVLIMTATPIPRTLGLMLYGDLDVSTLKELPFGERKVKTYWITKTKEKEIFAFVKKRLIQGDQAYIIFPLIEETEKSDLQAATEEYHKFQRGEFRDFKLGLIHGKIDNDEKARIMEEFRSGRIHLLVSTTVIEVGIDNPNASIIIIEHAERFGLSQLHQMRGRVGRRKQEAFCFLFGYPTTEVGKKRLRLMTKTNDGFRIAEEDLYLRGPGDFLGVRQSGLPEFKIADIVRDAEILKLAKEEAFREVRGKTQIDTDPASPSRLRRDG